MDQRATTPVHVDPSGTSGPHPGTPKPSRIFPVRYQKNPELFRNPKKYFPIYESLSPDHSGAHRDVLDPIRDSEQNFGLTILISHCSETPFGSARNISGSLLSFLWCLRCFQNYLAASSTLKCVTLRFGNTPDMIETPLRSMIISGTWIPIMTPMHSTRLVV